MSAKTYIWDMSTSQWNAQTDLPTARRNAFCAKVTTGLGEEEVVVAGGYDGSSRLDDVQIFSVTNGNWRTGVCQSRHL